MCVWDALADCDEMFDIISQFVIGKLSCNLGVLYEFCSIHPFFIFWGGSRYLPLKDVLPNVSASSNTRFGPRYFIRADNVQTRNRLLQTRLRWVCNPSASIL